MIWEHRQKAKNALWNYHLYLAMDEPQYTEWCLAVDEALAYYKSHDQTQIKLIKIRFFNHATEQKTLELLHIGRTTYQKYCTDIFSTIAIFAAKRGLL